MRCNAITLNYFIIFFFFQVSEFFKQHDLRSGDRTLQQSLEIVKFNIHWVKINAKSVNDWLIEYSTRKNDTS